jgi:hypothetical protein
MGDSSQYNRDAMARIRRSNRTRQQAIDARVAMEARVAEADFHSIWRKLRSRGWVSKRPKGLSSDWTYVSLATEEDDAMSFVGTMSFFMAV